MVSRYLMNHNYETINNVREWQMKLTQRHQVQEEVDKRVEKYKLIAQNAISVKNRLNKEFEAFQQDVEAKMQQNFETANTHSQQIADKLKEHMENGTYTEMANLVQSVYKSKQKKLNWSTMMNRGSN